MQYEVTTSRNGTIALAYAARQVAEGIAAETYSLHRVRLYVRPQADGSCLIVNGPKYENIWAFNTSPRTRKVRKGKK